MAVVQLLNSHEACVEDMLQGFCAAHPGLSLDLDARVVTVRGEKSSNVAIVSGGGSGHEPFAAGYVGHGMLSAAVAGPVFTSPPSSHVQSAIRSVATPAGTLVVIPNYTGDCLNFGLAIEKTRSEGMLVEGVVVGEDCALDSRESTTTGRRGMCGLLFVFKICGSLSALGRPLSELASTARKVVSSMATIGVGLRACRLPGQATTLFHIPDNQMEVGLGVHGEAGVNTVDACSAALTVEMMVCRLKSSLSLLTGDKVAVLVNNMGSLSQLEQWVIASEVEKQLTLHGMCVLRIYVGHLMTSLDATGVQVSVLKLPASCRSDWLSYLDAATDAPAWPGSSHSVSTLPRQPRPQRKPPTSQPEITVANVKPQVFDLTQRCLLRAAKALIGCEDKVNQMDSGCGDGDCGSTLRRLGEAITTSISDFAGLSRKELLQRLADRCEQAMGGTSGAIYSLLLTTAALAEDANSDWATAWGHGLEGVMRYSHARAGDRTMLDSLIPACGVFERAQRSTPAESVAALGCALRAAQASCDATTGMRARAGRASYVNMAHLTGVDAGALGVCIWLEAIYLELREATV